MIGWSVILFSIVCVAAGAGAMFYGADAWLHFTTVTMAALCWATRRHAYDGVIRLICAVCLSGGTFALVVNTILSAAVGTVEVAVVSLVCAVLSGMAASTQIIPAGRFISDAAGFIKNRMM